VGTGPLGNENPASRQLFKFGLDNGLLDRPVRFGSEFKEPSRKTDARLNRAKNRAKNGKRMFHRSRVADNHRRRLGSR